MAEDHPPHDNDRTDDEESPSPRVWAPDHWTVAMDIPLPSEQGTSTHGLAGAGLRLGTEALDFLLISSLVALLASFSPRTTDNPRSALGTEERPAAGQSSMDPNPALRTSTSSHPRSPKPTPVKAVWSLSPKDSSTSREPAKVVAPSITPLALAGSQPSTTGTESPIRAAIVAPTPPPAQAESTDDRINPPILPAPPSPEQIQEEAAQLQPWIILAFVAFAVLPIALAMAGTGRTPGMLLLGLAPVSLRTGQSPKIPNLAIRALLRLVDMLPLFFLAGLFSARKDPLQAGRFLSDQLAQTALIRTTPLSSDLASLSIPVTAYGTHELGYLVEALLERLPNLPPERAHTLAHRLAATIARQHPESITPELQRLIDRNEPLAFLRELLRRG